MLSVSTKTLFRSLRNVRNLRNYSISSSQKTQAFSEDDSSLWVHSPLPTQISAVKGVTIPEIIRENVGSCWGDLVAFESHEDPGRKYTHNQVLKNSQAFAAALIQNGLKRGEVVAVVLPNVPEYCSVVFGVWEAGLIASPVNPSYSEAETTRQLLSSSSVCVVTDAENLSSILKAKSTNPKIRTVIVVEKQVPEGCHSFYSMIKADTFGVEFFKGRLVDTEREVALLPFSSGTTGPPKGVMLSHCNLVTNLLQCDPSKGLSNIRRSDGVFQERQIGLLPFFHSYGMSCLIAMGMFLGANTRTLKKFDTNTFLGAVRGHKPTVLHLVTPLISHITNSDNYGAKELESAHSICGGAAPIGPTLINKLLEKAGKYFLFQEGYGMTEASPVTHILLPRTENRKIGSCGSPIPGTITKIVDPNGKTLGRNERGEILIKGPQVMLGYYNNPTATAATIDEGGWLHTGDIAYYDSEGDLYIVDRLKELIKVQGFQVSPSELEDLLRENEKIEDVAVIGVPDDQTGEAPRAYVVVKKGAKMTEEEIHDYLKPLVSRHKFLKGGVEFRGVIPKAPSGKILRRELAEEFFGAGRKL